MEKTFFSDPVAIAVVIAAIIGLIGAIAGAVILRGRKEREKLVEPPPEGIPEEAKETPVELPTEVVVPELPEPYFTYTFPLEKHFTGRLSERQLLTEWLTGDQRPVFVLEAIGGMGKSSLTWVWSHRDVAGLPVPGLPEDPSEVQLAVRVPEEHKPEGLLFWSYYEGGGTFQDFLKRAVAYCSAGEKSLKDYEVTVGQETRVNYGTMQEDLLQFLQQRRFLLIWDGAERLLREYAGPDATVREERDVEALEPYDRDVMNPAVARFLTDMAGQASSRLLLTSRLNPRMLERLAGAGREELTGLGEDDAAAYLYARGIRGTRADRSDLITAAREYDFHPLSLNNLAADLIKDFEQGGDIAAAPQYDETETLKARREHILARAYERRAPQLRELVSRMAALRGAIPKEVVPLLVEDIEGLRPEDLGRDLNELVRHGLLRHPSVDRYDFHPVVRRYCYQRLENKEKIHKKLVEYYKSVPVPDEVTTLEDVAPVIELYHHTVGAGRYDEACDLFHDRLVRLLHFRFGAYQTNIELLRALFPDGEDRPPRLEKESDQAWTMNTLASPYSLSGQPRLAVPLFEMHNELREKEGDKMNLGVGLGNLGTQLLNLGELAKAERSQRRRIELCREIEDEFREAVGHQELGRLLAYKGAFDEAARELDAAMASFSKLGFPQSECVTLAYRALRALLMGDAKDALEAAHRARELADEVARKQYPHESDIIRAEWLLGAALVSLASEERDRQNEHLAEAETHLTEALTRCRRINLVEMEPDILLAWAHWHLAKGDAEHAQEHAQEAMAIANRSEYRLKQAGIHNFLARLALDAGDQEAARQHAEVARERAECDGEPHSYKPALDEAEGLLREVENM